MENAKTNEIKSFKDLIVWQKAHKLSLDIAKLVKTFPKDEKYDLVSQMRRSARSIPSDISEGFGRFHFNDKLTFYERGRSSLLELNRDVGSNLNIQHWHLRRSVDTGCMIRPLRIHLPGAFYYITCRGIERSWVFTDNVKS